MKFILAVLAAAACACAATHYSYSGSDPAGWSRREISARPANAASGFTTYIGDAFEYNTARIIADPAGNTYIAGSRVIPYTGQGTTLTDVFVTKLDPSGNLLFTATFSGKGSDTANDLALDAAGNIYLAGTTSSGDFPVRSALLARSGPGFLLKLNPDGSQILFSTYFQGAIKGLALDAAGNIYLTGSTFDTKFPISPGLDFGHPSFGLPIHVSAFIAKVPPAADRILWSAVIGGNSVSCGGGSSCFLSTRSVAGQAIGIDGSNNPVIAGNANVTDIPTTSGAMLRTGIGAFVAKLKADGTGLVYLTYIGSKNYAYTPFSNPANVAAALAVDAAGNAYIAGQTNDPSFPATPGAVQPQYSGADTTGPYPPPQTDAFAAKLKPDGSGMDWATYLGGNKPDTAQSISLDAQGNVWLSGTTQSSEFPNQNGGIGGTDFVVGLNPAGSALEYSTRLPNGTASASAVLDASGMLHAAGTGGIVSTFDPAKPMTARILGIGNAAAGGLGGRVAPGEIVSLYGPDIGPATPATFQVGPDGLVPTTLAGTQVLFGNVPAPLLYVSAKQINAIVPNALSPGDSMPVHIASGSGSTPDFRVQAVVAAPEIFRLPDGITAAAVNQDGTINSADHPAKSGSVVSIWVTGVGFAPGPDGSIAPAANNTYCCTVAVNGAQADVLYGGASPGLVAAAMQVNFRVPEVFQAQTVDVQITAGQRDSSTAILNLAP